MNRKPSNSERCRWKGFQPVSDFSHGAWPCSLIALVVAMLLSAGCATSEHGARPPRPGEGLREYQRLLLDLRQDVTRTQQALGALAAATQKNSAAAYARFDESLQRLEVVSIKSRARADAMEKRGAAYFEEWAEEISRAAGESSRRAAGERFAEIRQHFDGILEDSQRMRQAFRKFIEGARELRVPLLQDPPPAAIETTRPELSRVAADGRLAEEAISQLLNRLSAAEEAVVSRPPPSTRLGGKS
jgi:hypothetical protein